MFCSLLVGCVWDVVTPACPAGGCLWGPTACVHPQGSSGCCAPIAPLPWEGIAANPKNKKLCPESREDRGSRFVVLRSSSLWFVSSGRVLGWETKGPRCLYSSGFFPSTFSSPLQAPGTSAQVGRVSLVNAASAHPHGCSRVWRNTLLTNTTVLILRGPCCCLLGDERREGRSRGLCSLPQLRPGLRSSEALQLIPRWRTEPWGY